MKKIILFWIIILTLITWKVFAYTSQEIENIAKTNWVNLYSELAKVNWQTIKWLINSYYSYLVEFETAPVESDDMNDRFVEPKSWIDWFKMKIWLSLTDKIDKLVENILENKRWLKRWNFEKLNKIYQIHLTIQKILKNKNISERKREIIKYLDMDIVYIWYKYSIWILNLEFWKDRKWFLYPKVFKYWIWY